jgi:hypothetical protein
LDRECVCPVVTDGNLSIGQNPAQPTGVAEAMVMQMRRASR